VVPSRLERAVPSFLAEIEPGHPLVTFDYIELDDTSPA
jgi:hypothetical protein